MRVYAESVEDYLSTMHITDDTRLKPQMYKLAPSILPSGRSDPPSTAGSSDQQPNLIPKRYVLGRALVEFLGDGKVRNDVEICESLIRRFGIDEPSLGVCKRTHRPRFRNEVDFAKGLVGDKGKGKGWIRQVSHKHYQILPAGLATL